MGFKCLRTSICWSRIFPNGDDLIPNEEGENKLQVMYQGAHYQLVASAIATKIGHEIDSQNQIGCMLSTGCVYPNTYNPQDILEAQKANRENYFL